MTEENARPVNCSLNFLTAPRFEAARIRRKLRREAEKYFLTGLDYHYLRPWATSSVFHLSRNPKLIEKISAKQFRKIFEKFRARKIPINLPRERETIHEYNYILRECKRFLDEYTIRFGSKIKFLTIPLGRNLGFSSIW